jgi:tetratricopeptide (TPR) repeat protein
MYRLILLGFLFTYCNNPKKPNTSTPSGIDSLVTHLRNSVNPYLRNREAVKAGAVLDSLKPFVDEINHYRLTGAWLRAKTAQKTIEERFDSAFYFGSKALKLAQEKDTTHREIIAAETQLADVLKEQNLNDSALKFARDAYYRAQKVDTTGLPLICLRLSEIYSKIGDLSMQRFYLFEGWRHSKQPQHKTVFANNIGSYYGKIGQNDSAILFYKAMEKDTSFSSPYFNAVKYENLGIHLTNQHRYQEGLVYQLKAAAINNAIGQMDGLSYFNLAATYRHLERYSTAIRYLDSAMTLAGPAKDWELIKRIWHARALNQKLQGSSIQAYASLDSAYSYYGVEVDSSILLEARELETQYKVKSKDDQIKSLAFENEAKTKINRQQQIIIFAIIAAGLLTGFVVFLSWRRRQLQMQVREAELTQQLLRTRMDPHLLFNLLSVLQSFMREGLYEKADEYVTQFSRLLRLSLENAGYSYASLKDEVAALESFLYLQQIHLDGRFEYKIELTGEPEDYDVFIPPMLMQPFVENSILHGFPRGYKGLISVRIACDSHNMRVTIEDNGVGLKEVSTAKGRRSSATIITEQRLRILGKRFRRPAKLSIIDKKAAGIGQGLKVELVIPYQKRRKNVVQAQAAA